MKMPIYGRVRNAVQPPVPNGYCVGVAAISVARPANNFLCGIKASGRQSRLSDSLIDANRRRVMGGNGSLPRAAMMIRVSVAVKTEMPLRDRRRLNRDARHISTLSPRTSLAV